jgi:hypothetical protein
MGIALLLLLHYILLRAQNTTKREAINIRLQKERNIKRERLLQRMIIKLYENIARNRSHQSPSGTPEF